jgi:hypothetical protein
LVQLGEDVRLSLLMTLVPVQLSVVIFVKYCEKYPQTGALVVLGAFVGTTAYTAVLRKSMDAADRRER